MNVTHNVYVEMPDFDLELIWDSNSQTGTASFWFDDASNNYEVKINSENIDELKSLFPEIGIQLS